MTPEEIIGLINSQLPTNGNNEITADVLRPVLIAMVEQINALVGDASNLPDGSNTVIEAINNIPSSGIQVLTGVANPNDIPPPDFETGDFYLQDGGSPNSRFWQFNSIDWIEILSPENQKKRNLRIVTGNTNVAIDDDVIIYNGANTNDIITLLSVLTTNSRKLKIVNISGFNINTSINYTNLEGSNITLLASNTVVELMSNGTIYYQINN